MSSSHPNQEREDFAQAQDCFQKGFELLNLGNLDEADALFMRALELDPKNLDALNLTGIRCYQKKEWGQAIHWLEQALAINRNAPHTLNNLGLAHHALGDNQAALACFETALKGSPHIAEIHNSKGMALKALKENTAAMEAFAQAIQYKQNYAEALNNLGIIYLEEGQAEIAIGLFEKAIASNPNFSQAFNHLGNALAETSRLEAAYAAFEAAIKLSPQYIDAYINFGNVLRKAKSYEGAIACFGRAASLAIQDERPHYLLGETYYEIGNAELAITHYEQASKLKPGNCQIELALAISCIPKISNNPDQLANSRVQFARKLAALQGNPPTFEPDPEQALRNIGAHPFYLAYQDFNNKNYIHEFNQICQARIQNIQTQLNHFKKDSKLRQKIRLGIVSEHLCDHPVWQAISKGLITNINPNLFELYIYNVNGKEDDQTTIAKDRAAQYIKHGGSILGLAQTILKDALDIVLYPEIGMAPKVKALASLRLAPIQMVSWGHPETTGISTIDYFISAQWFELDEYQNNYSEQVILLPNTGTYIERALVEAQKVNVGDFGLDPSKPILICAGSPSKYSPENDHIFIEIAKQNIDSQFIFFDFQNHLSTILFERLNTAFVNAQMDPRRHLKFLPFLSKEKFYGLLNEATLYLDTIGFSGFNTAMQAIECELPIITMAGQFMRGNLAAGILRQLGLQEYICSDKQSYVNSALRLLDNTQARNDYKNQIHTQKEGLFFDRKPIQYLEAYLIELVQNQKEA